MEEQRRLETELRERSELSVYPSSTVEVGDTSFSLARTADGRERMLVVWGKEDGFEGVRHEGIDALLCKLTTAHAAALRARLPWLRPAPLGLRTSTGFGDRLGLATPGHIRAIRQVRDGADRIAPIFAQQSVRENARTGRTPQQVLDDATWGVFQEGWRDRWGADADHLKTPGDVEAFAAAGYTFFTIDPGDHVDDTVEGEAISQVDAKVRDLPWQVLEDTPEDLRRRYSAAPIELEESSIVIEEWQLWRAAAKYGRAVAHTATMYHHIVQRMADRVFELEVSVDETASPTTAVDHIYVAGELRRLGVRWVSLAPRFVGRFEKGVDYIGDLEEFSAEFARHAAIARAYGPYKLSLHSGSDKFSAYPIAARLTGHAGGGANGPLVHVKTAGTSYLEALRAIALVDAELFREMLACARDRYETDRATYHVSARLANVPAQQAMDDADLAPLLEHLDARQILHVTFGSVLERFGDRLRNTLKCNEELYNEVLEAHFVRHLSPFVE
jgi:hypothetical protein